jgi:hypothetical protein
VKGECACESGWAGLECQHDARCPNFCSLRGTCRVDAVAVACVCPPGWGGYDCSRRLPLGTPIELTLPQATSTRWRAELASRAQWVQQQRQHDHELALSPR